MATLIATADGNLTGATTFAAAETGTGALNLVRNSSASSFGAANTVTSSTFTVTSGKVIDAVLLWVRTTYLATGTFKVDLQKGGVSQASVTVDKNDIYVSDVAIPAPTLFKLTTTATGDGAANWTIVVTTTGFNLVAYYRASASANDFTRALRTTTTQAPVATDDLYIVGELTGVTTKNNRLVTMNSTAATAYGNGALNSSTVNGGGIHISNWGTLTYGTTAATAYILRIAGDMIVYQYGALNIVSPQTSTTQVLEFQPVSADGDFGLRCLDNSVVTITGQPRTAGKNVVQCKLTADVASSNVAEIGINISNATISATALEASGNSLLASGITDNTSNATHSAFIQRNAGIVNTTQTATVWIARGSGLNNRYVRVLLGNNASVSGSTNGCYSDIDLQAGTAGTVVAFGNGTATSVSITPEGRGFVIKLTGRVSTASSLQAFHVAACSAPGTVTYVGNTTQCFIVDHMALVTVASIPDTTFSVDTDTGWLAGDVVCVASTTRATSECEIYPLNANAGASSFTSVLYPFSGTVASTHSGTAPTQAEIGLLTRNVKIRSTSNTLMTYVYCTARATVTASWAEFYYLGANAANKKGIEIDGSAGAGPVANPKSFTYCSLHDCDYVGLYFLANGSASLNVVFSNNVLWNSYASHFVILTGPVTGTDWTMESNLVMKMAGSAFSLTDVGGVFNNNTVVGSVGTSAVNLGEATNYVTLREFNGNTIHSCNALGLVTTSSLVGTINNLTIWRTGAAGLANQTVGQDDLHYTNLILFGNASSQGSFQFIYGAALNINGGVIAGDPSFACQNGFNLVGNERYQFDVRDLDMSGVGAGLMPHTIADIHYGGSTQSLFGANGTFNNCLFGAPALVDNKDRWSTTASIGFQKFNQVAGDHRTEMKYGQLRTDQVNYHTAAPSMRMTTNSINKLESAPGGRGIQAAVKSGATVTAKVWIRKDYSYGGSTQPRLILRANTALGINSDVVLATATGSTASAMFNPATATDTALSNGNLTATYTAPTGAMGVRVTPLLNTGKYYFEIKVLKVSGLYDSVGLMSDVASYSEFAVNAQFGCSIIAKGGGIYINGANTAVNIGAMAANDVFGIAVDLDARLIWCRKNGGSWNNDGSNPATPTGGFAILANNSVAPAVAFAGAGSAVNDAYTANFGATAFANAAPAGFAGWPGNNASTDWQQLSGVTPAATDDGAMEFIVDCEGIAGFINVDDWEFTTGGAKTTNDLSVWADGLPVSGTSGGGGGAYFSAGFV